MDTSSFFISFYTQLTIMLWSSIDLYKTVLHFGESVGEIFSYLQVMEI